jgi:hypothetical protein
MADGTRTANYTAVEHAPIADYILTYMSVLLSQTDGLLLTVSFL